MVEVVFHLIVLRQAKQIAMLHIHQILRLKVKDKNKMYICVLCYTIHPKVKGQSRVTGTVRLHQMVVFF